MDRIKTLTSTHNNSNAFTREHVAVCPTANLEDLHAKRGLATRTAESADAQKGEGMVYIASSFASWSSMTLAALFLISEVQYEVCELEES